MASFSLDAQIAEVERELMLRRRVYPVQVVQRRLRQAEADYHIDCMNAVLATLLRLRDQRIAMSDA